MKLYTFFRSSASFRLRIALNLKGLDHEPVFVSLPKMENFDPEFTALNPQQLLPALVDGDDVLLQSMATIEYLDETYPEPALMPGTPSDRAYVRAISHGIACDISPLNNIGPLRVLENEMGVDADKRQVWYEYWIKKGFTALEALLTQRGMSGKYCFGDQVTLADICLVPQVFNAKRFNCPLEDYPKLMGIFENLMQLQAFKDAAPDNQPDKV
jgi:maleylacetoacetate isomerase